MTVMWLKSLKSQFRVNRCFYSWAPACEASHFTTTHYSRVPDTLQPFFYINIVLLRTLVHSNPVHLQNCQQFLPSSSTTAVRGSKITSWDEFCSFKEIFSKTSADWISKSESVIGSGIGVCVTDAPNVNSSKKIPAQSCKQNLLHYTWPSIFLSTSALK